MNFFEQQRRSRKKTALLTALFLGGALATAAAAGVVAYLTANMANMIHHYVIRADIHHNPDWLDAGYFYLGCLLALVCMAVASALKIRSLGRGGAYVAGALGARLIRGGPDLTERKLLNVTEEMAIASGLPVPGVYVLDADDAINALTAGNTPDDAVIAVTRGALDHLNRDELQGVVAHEFAHILSGDMRNNTRLIGVLGGVFFFAGFGKQMVKTAFRAAVPVIAWTMYPGMAFTVIGFGGRLFGRLVQSAVSREQEFAADAAAVQFTRYPHGILNALKKIGRFRPRLAFENPFAEEVSHMFFFESVDALFATHPPVADRIRRFEPTFDGDFRKADLHAFPEYSETPYRGFSGEETVVRPDQAAAAVGKVTPDHIRQGQGMLAAIPARLRAAAEDTEEAVVLACGLALDRDPAEADRQIAALRRNAPADLADRVADLADDLKELNPGLRLPLLDLAMPALRRMTSARYAELLHNLQAMCAATRRMTLFEFCIQEIIARRLGAAFSKKRDRTLYSRLESVLPDIAALLSRLAEAGHADHAMADAAFASAVGTLPSTTGLTIPPGPVSFSDLRAALDRLSLSDWRIREATLNACAHCVCYDRKVTAAEAELLRAVAYAMGLPLPPFLIRPAA